MEPTTTTTAERRTVGGAAPSKHYSIVSCTPGHSLAVEVLEERDHVLPGEAGQVLEGPHLDLLSRAPPLPDLGLHGFQVIPVDEESRPHAVQGALRHQNARDAIQDLYVLPGALRQGRELHAREPRRAGRVDEERAGILLAGGQ